MWTARFCSKRILASHDTLNKKAACTQMILFQDITLKGVMSWNMSCLEYDVTSFQMTVIINLAYGYFLHHSVHYTVLSGTVWDALKGTLLPTGKYCMQGAKEIKCSQGLELCNNTLLHKKASSFHIIGTLLMRCWSTECTSLWPTGRSFWGS